MEKQSGAHWHMIQCKGRAPGEHCALQLEVAAQVGLGNRHQPPQLRVLRGSQRRLQCPTDGQRRPEVAGAPLLESLQVVP